MALVVVVVDEPVHGTIASRQYDAHNVHVAQIGRRCESHHDGCADFPAGHGIDGKSDETAETVCQVESAGDRRLDQHVVGLVDIPVDTEEPGIFEG